ncbi:hypothetical protein D3C81_1125700 [compost metagenome]
MPPNTTRIGDTPITMWKCATTKYVFDSGISTLTLPRNSPVSPPMTKVLINAIANSIGTEKWMSPRHSVMTQL